MSTSLLSEKLLHFFTHDRRLFAIIFEQLVIIILITAMARSKFGLESCRLWRIEASVNSSDTHLDSRYGNSNRIGVKLSNIIQVLTVYIGILFSSSPFGNSRDLTNYDLQVSSNGQIIYYIPVPNFLNPVAILDKVDSSYTASFFFGSWGLTNTKMKIVNAKIDTPLLGSSLDSNVEITSTVFLYNNNCTQYTFDLTFIPIFRKNSRYS